MGGLGMSILEEGIEEGTARQLLMNVNNLSKSLNVSIEEACRLLGITLAEYEQAKKLKTENKPL